MGTSSFCLSHPAEDLHPAPSPPPPPTATKKLVEYAVHQLIISRTYFVEYLLVVNERMTLAAPGVSENPERTKGKCCHVNLCSTSTLGIHGKPLKFRIPAAGLPVQDQLTGVADVLSQVFFHRNNSHDIFIRCVWGRARDEHDK